MNTDNSTLFNSTIFHILSVLISSILFVGVFVLVLFYFIFSSAFVFVHLWNWFILPVFPHLPEINMIQAFGIMLIASYTIKGNNSYREQKKDIDKNEKIAKWVSYTLYPWFVFLIGWITYKFFIL